MEVFGDGKFQKDEIFHPQKRGDVLKPVRQSQNQSQNQRRNQPVKQPANGKIIPQNNSIGQGRRRNQHQNIHRANQNQKTVKNDFWVDNYFYKILFAILRCTINYIRLLVEFIPFNLFYRRMAAYAGI
jgi:hypothetical protein